MMKNWYQRYSPYEQAALAGRGPNALLKLLLLSAMVLLLPLMGLAQGNRTISGKVTDDTSSGLPGVTIIVPGTTTGTSSGPDGSYSLSVPESATKLSFSFVGYSTQVADIVGKTAVSVSLKTDAQALNEVVVVGYGTARKQDLTGAVAVIGEKDFNKGTFTSPDQLIQGRTSGVQFTSASGQPGGAANIKIRGSSAVTGSGQPLYVVDGVPLDGRTARPGLTTAGILENGTDSNPLNFLNPNDIESITVLKDASATAIYGSRAAYGVVLINTKRGKSGAAKLDVLASTGVASIMRRAKYLDAGQYRQALAYYGVAATNDKGSSVNALDEILRTGVLQNYSLGLSGGNENGRYRLSVGYLDQDGIVRKTGFKKYSANLATNFDFLESKKLGVDVNISASQFREQLAAISNNAGFRGSLISQALQWNPTQSLRNSDGSLFIQQGDVINPLAASELFDDNSRVTTALASVSPHYKITDWLEARVLYSANYSSGIRRTSIGQALNYSETLGLGLANIGTTELLTQQIANTLNVNKKLGEDLNLNAVLGYEFTRFEYSGTNTSAKGPGGLGTGFGSYGQDYTNYIQFSDPGSRKISSFFDPTVKLQSYFGRVILNYKERYLVTATIRADQSSKFGPDNRTGYFPSVALGWDLSHEDFFKVAAVNQLKLRAGYGRTGNQEFPAGSASARYAFNDNGDLKQLNADNPKLKWQSDTQYNLGLDAALFDNRLTFTADYFYKTTTDLLFPKAPIQPAAPAAAIQWANLPGEVVNKGVELAVGGTIVNGERLTLGLNANATFIRNNVTGLPFPIVTGEINGAGLSGVQAEVIQNGSPINSFYLQTFTGLNEKGQNTFGNGGALSIVGSPNPTTLLGLSLNARYRKLSLVANATGVYGQYIYNNTLNAVGNVGQIGAGRNIALSVFENSVKESTGNPAAPSTRWLEKGDYFKLSNLTLSYGVGDLGTFKGINVFATGQNLFVITKYTGFDPEINTNKSVNGVPSVGIDYAGYPTARTFTFGLNVSL